jgi:hypothetical protein
LQPPSSSPSLSLLSGEVPIARKAATVRPLFKGGDQADPNDYLYFALFIKSVGKLVNNHLTVYLDVYSILSGMQSGFH